LSRHDTGAMPVIDAAQAKYIDSYARQGPQRAVFQLPTGTRAFPRYIFNTGLTPSPNCNIAALEHAVTSAHNAALHPIDPDQEPLRITSAY
jgi:hypothetical protein